MNESISFSSSFSGGFITVGFVSSIFSSSYMATFKSSYFLFSISFLTLSLNSPKKPPFCFSFSSSYFLFSMSFWSLPLSVSSKPGDVFLTGGGGGSILFYGTMLYSESFCLDSMSCFTISVFVSSTELLKSSDRAMSSLLISLTSGTGYNKSLGIGFLAGFSSFFLIVANTKFLTPQG